MTLHCRLTLRTYLLLSILSIILQVMLSSYLNFGLLLMANIAWPTQALSFGSYSIYLFDRLSHWTLTKSVLNWLISQACWTLSCPILSTRHEWKNTFDNLYERTSCCDSRSRLDPTDRLVKWKMYCISSLKQRSDMNHSRVQGRYTVYPTLFKQRSDISHAKEQAPYTLCMSRSLRTFSTRTTRLPLHRAPFERDKQQNL